MAEVMKVEIRQACALTGSFKGVSGIIVSSSLCIVKDPWYVVPRSKPAEQAPQGFIEWQRPGLPILGLLQADKPVRHIHQVPREAQ